MINFRYYSHFYSNIYCVINNYNNFSVSTNFLRKTDNTQFF